MKNSHYSFLFARMIVLIILLFTATSMESELSAETTPCIRVLLEATPVVIPLDKTLIRGRGLGRVKLSFFVYSGSPITIKIPKHTDLVDGLIIEHDGTKLKESTSSLKLENLQEVELANIGEFTTNWTTWMHTGGTSISETGIYHISYSHPYGRIKQRMSFLNQTLCYLPL